MMCDSPSSTERQQGDHKDMLELNKNSERMIEDVENISVQLTWMAYDMVVQRTSPEQGDMMLRLQDAYKRCKAFICREEDDSEFNKEPQEDK
ncbi:synaptonemal complex central element protein 3 [Gadus morhua]|nr:synaptonemal complex central element protein 3 [Gadus morhua]